MDAVRAARLDEVGPVVEHEERAVRVACRTKRLGRRDELLVGELLVAELDDVDSAAQRGLEHGDVSTGKDEIELRASQPVAHEHTFA